MQPNSEVTKQENKSVVIPEKTHAGEALKSDVLIPRLLLMQGLSDFVMSRKAQLGEIVRSTNVEIVGNPESPIEIIPLAFKNSWIIKEKPPKSDKFEFRRMETRDAKSEDLPWDYKENGTDWKRVKAINVFCLLPRDIVAMEAELAKAKASGEMPDLDKTLLPVMISFQSTSYNAGKAVVTHFVKAEGMAQYGAKAHGFTLKLSVVADKNDKGSYFVFQVANGRKCSKAEYAEAEKWFGLLSSSSNIRVDEEAPEAEASAADKSGLF